MKMEPIQIKEGHLYKKGDTDDSVIKRTNKVLGSAKSSGRNRIEFIYNTTLFI